MTTIQLIPQQQTQAYVLCADCGTAIEPNSSGLCVACLRNTIDITESIPKQATLNFCKNCERYLSPPQTWLPAELESRELLAICLRRLKGLKEVRLVDAGFIWTEPHSKRLRVKLTVQKEVLASTILQQVFEVEFVIQFTQCPECTRLAAKNTWRALVQVRQKVDHKRTFLYLEQLILKHGADKDTVSIREVKDGLDFFYASRQHAAKMVDFLTAVAPVRVKASEQLISLDVQNSTTNYKSTFSVEIAAICKDDLVCLPKKFAAQLSNIAQLALCARVGNSMHLIDPFSLQTVEVAAPVYWRAPFSPLASAASGAATTEFMVLDIEPTSHPPKVSHNGRFLLAEAQVTPVAGTMDADGIFTVLTHLGAVLKPGDTCLGYLLTSANFNNEDWDRLPDARKPEVILIRKTFPERKKRGKKRNWRLKSMVKEVGEGEHAGLGREKVGAGARGGRGAPGGAQEQAKAEAQYEAFLRDLEEDEELRSGINLWKSVPRAPEADRMDIESEAGESTYTNGEESYPKGALCCSYLSMDILRDILVHVKELLDDMEGLTIEEEES